MIKEVPEGLGKKVFLTKKIGMCQTFFEMFLKISKIF